ncbi:hypothetical protein MCOR07_010938 [Pyricularia oryzae]|nr:hypothetical protein MCOR01_000434 [Pyricularia oryzae]KAI6272969.1 hypothetical protein MCOR26_007120 [Pyricularia oryzae]KAI6399621.1 hypothetical protein MCOR20_008763 [Pyricularia oryzae]KAI6425097.1 hypothetical protein MCOR22_011082 [Pyricularia oryzae]KAI6597022.1 hypothetical protein MCOR06_002247 [Pyricularia oryzae]
MTCLKEGNPKDTMDKHKKVDDDLHTHNEVENCRDILFNAEAYRWLCSQKARHWFPLTSFGASAILLAGLTESGT